MSDRLIMPPLTSPVDAADAIQLAHDWARRAAEHRRHLAELEFERPRVKDRAIRSAMGALDSAGRQVSYTAAEKTVESHPDFEAHCRKIRETQFDLDVAVARADAYGRFAQLLIHHESQR